MIYLNSLGQVRKGKLNPTQIVAQGQTLVPCFASWFSLLSHERIPFSIFHSKISIISPFQLL